jgi:hypothetical protein
MSGFHPLWLVLSFALAAGLNHVTKPDAEYALSAGERTLGSGELWLEGNGQRQVFKLVAIRVVIEDVPRLLADPLIVRALWLRSPEQDGAPPDLELFVDLAGFAQPLAAEVRDAGALRGQELSVLPAALAADTRSRVRFRGAEAPAQVKDGKLIIREALRLGEPAQGFRVQGSLELSIEDGEQTRELAGEFNARLVWN